MFKPGQTVHATAMPRDSFYREIKGTVENAHNGLVVIRAVVVKSKWRDQFTRHPGCCVTVALARDVVAIDPAELEEVA